jgi:hypothetical protein
MKFSLYFSLILLAFSSYVYSKQFDVADGYKGVPIIESIGMGQLEKDCQKIHDFWQLTNNEREKNRESCPINQIAPYFNNLYEVVNKNIDIYDNGELKLIINKKEFNRTINDNSYPVNALNLSLTDQGNIKDTITLANIYYDVISYYWLSNQYYYINPNGNIYILLVKDFGSYIQPVFWKHYQIDKENLQFKLKEFLFDDGYKYRIIYPDQFEVPDKSEPSNFETDKLRTCYQDEYNTTCNIESYNYYHDLLVKKLALLQAKENEPKDSIEVIDKQINKACLMIPPPVYHNEATTFTHKITRCLTEQIKQQIEKIDNKLNQIEN